MNNKLTKKEIEEFFIRYSEYEKDDDMEAMDAILEDGEEEPDMEWA